MLTTHKDNKVNSGILNNDVSESDRFSGVLAPVVTPFDAQLNPDRKRLERHCRWLLGNDVGLAIFGTNSEANSLSTDEKLDLLNYLVDSGIDQNKLMPGTGCCALTDSVRLTKEAVNLGCKGVLMLPPFYYKGVSDEGLYASYSEIIERVGSSKLKIYLYHIPPIAQIPLSISLIDRLVKQYPDTVVGIKDSSGDWSNTKKLLDSGWNDFRVFCGSESFLLENMRNGGAGCISATANVNPAAIYNLYQNCNTKEADDLQAQVNQVRQLFQQFPMIPALKSTIANYSEDDNWHRLRPPLLMLDNEAKTSLDTKLRNIGFEMPNL
jgi:4-hydroxy-tetrahydrodipicolinate synthase